MIGLGQALKSSEQSFDLVPQFAESPVVVSFDFLVRLWWHDRRHPQGPDKAPSLVAFLDAVHRRWRFRDRLAPAFQQGAAFGRIVGMPRNEFAAP